MPARKGRKAKKPMDEKEPKAPTEAPEEAKPEASEATEAVDETAKADAAKVAADDAMKATEDAKEAQKQKDLRAEKEKSELAAKTVNYVLEDGATVDAIITKEHEAGTVDLELIVPEIHQHFLPDEEKGANVPKRVNVPTGTTKGTYSRK